jgi:hypothetical protein
MAVRLGVVRAGPRGARALAAHSRTALDRPLGGETAELWVATAVDDAIVLGAFQRGAQVPEGGQLVRRGTGGPEVRLGAGTVHVTLSLPHPGALLHGDERRIVNRAVRPLLRALTATGALAHFFGRDWVSVAHRPAAWVGFAHETSTRRTLFEAFVAVRAPFSSHRASFLGKAPATLEALAGHPIDEERLVERIVDSYAAASGAEAIDLPVPEIAVTDEDLRSDPPWAATCEEAIGTLGAGPDAHGVCRVGGDLLVSRDALANLERRLEATDDDGVTRLVDETLAAPGVALDGIRSLRNVRDLILAARHR